MFPTKVAKRLGRWHVFLFAFSVWNALMGLNLAVTNGVLGLDPDHQTAEQRVEQLFGGLSFVAWPFQSLIW